MNQLNIKGRVLYKNDIGFEQTVLATLFNQRATDRRPEMYVQAQNTDEVLATVRFAKAQGMKVSICSGGHSWSANHLRPGSLLLDMSQFDQFQVEHDRMVATAGPGVGGSILLAALWKRDLFFPAGHCKGVCIGGYLLQGGFGWHGRKLGMACESVIGLDIVTADGELIHASPTENADLYWSARGSGGGFFGVVIRFHLRLYPRPRYSGSVMHVFRMSHLEEVLHWAAEVGPSVPKSVEFQMLMSQRTVSLFGPGIEAFAPIFADSKEELHEAMTFMQQSPVKKKAFLRTPFIPCGMDLMYRFAMTHYPSNHCWGVDNMWTDAAIDQLVPYLKEMVKTLPPPPAHILWLNWEPPTHRPDMAFSMEEKIYIALYGAWKSPNDTAKYGSWAGDWMQKMAHLSSGIQLADENLNHRAARFVADKNLQKLDAVRAQRDPAGLFHEWHSRPAI